MPAAVATRRAPYAHADGSNCWTKDCRNRQAPDEAFSRLIEALGNDEERAHGEAVYSTIYSSLDDELPAHYRDEVLAVMQDYWTRYGLPQIGRTRAVFDTGDGYVVKVAYNTEGDLASGAEYATHLMEDPFIPVAECDFVMHNGLRVLRMEKVEPLRRVRYKELPEWVGWVDCGQVGYNRAGKLVAYDL